MTRQSLETDPYIALSNAIILQAVEDYRLALAGGAVGHIKECETFFRSGYFALLTKLDGSALIQQIRNEVLGGD